jgi:hypothetical protein
MSPKSLILLVFLLAVEQGTQGIEQNVRIVRRQDGSSNGSAHEIVGGSAIDFEGRQIHFHGRGARAELGNVQVPKPGASFMLEQEVLASRSENKGHKIEVGADPKLVVVSITDDPLDDRVSVLKQSLLSGGFSKKFYYTDKGEIQLDTPFRNPTADCNKDCNGGSQCSFALLRCIRCVYTWQCARSHDKISKCIARRAVLMRDISIPTSVRRFRLVR